MHTKVRKNPICCHQKRKKKSWKNSSMFLLFIKLQTTINNLVLIQNIFSISVVVNHIIFSSILCTYSHFLSFYMSLKKNGGGKLGNSLWTINHLNSYTLNPPAIRKAFFFPVCNFCLFISLWFLFLPYAQKEEFLQVFEEKMAFIGWPVSLLLTELQYQQLKQPALSASTNGCCKPVSHTIASL